MFLVCLFGCVDIRLCLEVNVVGAGEMGFLKEWPDLGPDAIM